MANYLAYPFAHMRITQGYNGTTSHKPHTTAKDFKDYPLDDGGKDTSNSEWFICPCNELEVKRIYGVGNKGTNTIWFESTSKVFFANGKVDYCVIMVIHPSDSDLKKIKVGQKFKRGDKIFKEGMDGATGYHHHISVGSGHFKGNGWVKNANGKYVIYTTGKPLKPEQAFFPVSTDIINGNKLKWKKFDTSMKTTANLRLRTEPNTNCPTLEIIPKGTSVLTIKHNDEWQLVLHNGKIGYCAKEWLK